MSIKRRYNTRPRQKSNLVVRMGEMRMGELRMADDRMGSDKMSEMRGPGSLGGTKKQSFPVAPQSKDQKK